MQTLNKFIYFYGKNIDYKFVQFPAMCDVIKRAFKGKNITEVVQDCGNKRGQTS